MSCSSINHGRLLAVGVCLPAVLAAADHSILTTVNIAKFGVASIAVLFTFFAVQIWFVSWTVARFISPWPLRWFIWVWTMVLIDLQLALMAAADSREPIKCLATGVLAGQVGALVVWGILGSGPIVWRVPSLLILLPIGSKSYDLLVRVSGTASWYQLAWNDLLWVQAMILSLLCCVLRLSGFTLAMKTPEIMQAPETDRTNRSLQFGIRDVLIGTTFLAVVLGIAKAGGMLTWQFVPNLYAAGLLFVALIATCTAAVLLIALWASVGRGRSTLRTLVVALASLIFASPIAWYCVNIGQPQMILNRDYRLFHWYATGYWWIGWMFLTATILAGSLIIFRTLGYRLIRTPHGERLFSNRCTGPSEMLSQQREVIAS